MTRWKDVAKDIDKRIEYHNDNFQELVQSAETLTRDMEARYSYSEGKLMVQVLRLTLDGMVKCFDMLYSDVQSGCPGWKPAQWVKADAVHTELSIAELVAIGEALAYARAQVSDSYIPVFGGIGSHIGINSEGDQGYTVEQVEQAQQLVDGIMNKIQCIINFSAGTIVTNG